MGARKNVFDGEYVSFCIKIKVAGNESLIAQCKTLAKDKRLTQTFIKSVKNSSKQLELNV